jgi:SAM-dependent methyltransferase
VDASVVASLAHWHSMIDPLQPYVGCCSRFDMFAEDNNFNAFSSPEVVEFYANSSGLLPAEAYAFEKFVPQGAAILDIGVGCGRTTPYLAAKARRYVGIDYVKAMIDVCTIKFPEHFFCCADATQLTKFEDASFDVVVFSFNGIDAIPAKDARLRCFLEVYRVLKPGGRFIFSSHNAKMLLNLPSLDNAGICRKLWRVARAAITSVPFAVRLLRSGAFRAGAGYYHDPVHGGIRHYCSTPELVKLDVRSSGFQLLEVTDNLHRRNVSHHFVSAYYYVAVKPLDRRA